MSTLSRMLRLQRPPNLFKFGRSHGFIWVSSQIGGFCFFSMSRTESRSLVCSQWGSPLAFLSVSEMLPRGLHLTRIFSTYRRLSHWPRQLRKVQQQGAAFADCLEPFPTDLDSASGSRTLLLTETPSYSPVPSCAQPVLPT